MSSMSLTSDSAGFVIVGGRWKNMTLKLGEKLELCEIKIRNTGNKSLTLNWKTLKNTFPKEWDYSMCAYGKCQVGVPDHGSFRPISPGKTGFIAIHIFPKNQKGRGVVEFNLIDENNPAYSERVGFDIAVE